MGGFTLDETGTLTEYDVRIILEAVTNSSVKKRMRYSLAISRAIKAADKQYLEATIFGVMITTPQFAPFLYPLICNILKLSINWEAFQEMVADMTESE